MKNDVEGDFRKLRRNFEQWWLAENKCMKFWLGGEFEEKKP